ncbi:MAG: hypothetical protein CME06_16420 [Gemmatimonadetes bacterium]|nr:hypothetical protein [Gemmatimonadota bacterium]
MRRVMVGVVKFASEAESTKLSLDSEHLAQDVGAASTHDAGIRGLLNGSIRCGAPSVKFSDGGDPGALGQASPRSPEIYNMIDVLKRKTGVGEHVSDGEARKGGSVLLSGEAFLLGEADDRAVAQKAYGGVVHVAVDP